MAARSAELLRRTNPPLHDPGRIEEKNVQEAPSAAELTMKLEAAPPLGS